MNRKVLVSLVVALVLGTSILSYFAKPKAPIIEIVSAVQELPGVQPSYPGDTVFADKVVKSYNWALVLVKTEFGSANVVALDSLRRWATDNFRKDPHFLHPIIIPVPEPHLSVFDSAVYNLFAPIKYFLEERTADVLRWRIQEFRKTNAYKSFQVAYYDLFDVDAESATLLARYQSERAKLAINVILCAVYWVIAILTAAFWYARARQGQRSSREQRLLAYGWLCMGAYYFVLAWTTQQVSVLVSAVLALALGFYLRRPVTVSFDQNSGLSFRLIALGPRILALVTWLSISLIAIQGMTWIKSGVLSDPDPITLLVSSFTGNFLHDPTSTKRTILRIIGIVWVIASVWTLRFIRYEASGQREIEEQLDSLDTIERPLVHSR